MPRRDVGNEVIVALAAIGTLALALTFGVVLTLSRNVPTPQVTGTVVTAQSTTGAASTPAGTAASTESSVVTGAAVSNATGSATGVATTAATGAGTTVAQRASETVAVTQPATTAATAAATNSATITATRPATNTVAPSNTPRPTKRPSNTPTPLPSDTPTAKPSNTPTKRPSNTPTPLPSDTPTPEPSDTPTPLPTATPTRPPTRTPTNTPSPTPIIIILVPPSDTPILTASCTPRSDWVPYVVQVGDTLFSISRRAGVTLPEMQTANCISDPATIYAGQVILVPPGANMAVTPTVATAVNTTGQATIFTCANPLATIKSPKNGDVLSGDVYIYGKANIPDFSFYKLELQAGGSSEWVSFTRSPIASDNVLGLLHTKLYTPGTYLIMLTVVNQQSTYPLPCAIRVTLTH